MSNFAEVTPRMVIVYPRGQLKAADRKTMKDAGIVAIEADDPDKVVTVLPMVPVSIPATSGDMAMALLHAVVHGNEGQKFATELYRRAKLNEEPGAAP